MALNPAFAAETAINSNHASFSNTLGEMKARLLRIAVNLLNGTGNRDCCKASHQIFPSNSAFFTFHVLQVRAKEEDSSSNVAPGTATLQNVYFEPEDGIVEVHPSLNTVQNFSARLQTFIAKVQIYCDNHRKVTIKVCFFPATLQLYSDKVQTFTVKVRIIGAKVQNDGAILKNAGNRSYRLRSKRHPFTFCTVGAII